MSKFAVLVEHNDLVRVVGSLDDRESVFQEFAQRPRAIDLFQVMITYDIDQLWVAPGHLGIGAEDTQAAFLQHDQLWDLKPYFDSYISSVHGYKKIGRYGAPDRKMRSIIWPEFTAWRWSSKEAPPFTLLLALGALEQAGIIMAGSPPMVARKLFVSDLEARNRTNWMTAQPLSLLEQYPWNEAGKDAVWKRQFGRYTVEEELRALLSHRPDYDPAAPLVAIAVDKSSTFPAASQSTPYGVGDPVDFSAATGQIWNKEEHGGKPGLWHIYAQRPIDCTYDDVNGPSPLHHSESEDYLQEWVTTPLLDLLHKQGWNVQIYEGVYWPRSRRLFEDFAPAMWEKRQHFRKLAAIHTEDGRPLAHYQLAFDSMKRIMNSFFGMFASAKNRDKQYLRRDIWATTVEAAKANMFYNMDKIRKEDDAEIIGVITDCLVIITQKPTAAQALRSIMNREDKLGGYKVKWELQVDAFVLAALAQKETSDMMHDLNELAARQKVGE